MQAVDGLQLQMPIFTLLKGGFQVDAHNSFQVAKLANVLEYTFMAYLAYADLDASCIALFVPKFRITLLSSLLRMMPMRSDSAEVLTIIFSRRVSALRLTSF